MESSITQYCRWSDRANVEGSTHAAHSWKQRHMKLLYFSSYSLIFFLTLKSLLRTADLCLWFVSAHGACNIISHPQLPDFTSVIQLERGTPPSTLISPTCRPLPLPLRLRLSSSVFRLPSSVVRLPLSFPSLPTPVQNYTLYILQFTLIHIKRLSSDLSAVALHSPPVALHYQLSTLHSSLSTLNSPSLLQSPYP